MPFVAPWNVPPNYLGAIESGARIGLSQAEQAQQAELERERLAAQQSEASGRLGLAYAQLAQEKEMANRLTPYQSSELSLAQTREQREAAAERARLDLTGKELQQRQAEAEASNKLRGSEQAIELKRIGMQYGNKAANQQAFDQAKADVASGMDIRDINMDLLTPAQASAITRLHDDLKGKKGTEPTVSVALRGDSKFGPSPGSIRGSVLDPRVIAAMSPGMRKQLGVGEPSAAAPTDRAALIRQIHEQNPNLTSAEIADLVNKQLAGAAIPTPSVVAPDRRSAVGDYLRKLESQAPSTTPAAFPGGVNSVGNLSFPLPQPNRMSPAELGGGINTFGPLFPQPSAYEQLQDATARLRALQEGFGQYRQ